MNSITALSVGGHGQGPRMDAAAVPEPGSLVLSALGLLATMQARRRGQ